MKKAALCVLALVGLSVWLLAQRDTPNDRPLPAMMPSGALLYLEAQDLKPLLSRWEQSDEHKRWLRSKNFGTLSQSRLIERLQQAQTQFEAVAGVSVSLNLVDQAAGGRSALAFYDLSALHFAYISQIGEAQLAQNSLWKGRAGYELRKVADIPFYSKTQVQDGTTRTVCFTSHNGWFVLTTDADLMHRVLALQAGQPVETLSTERWFADAVKATGAPGELRMVYDMKALGSTPQFRTYWIHRNSTELSAFTAGVVDLIEDAKGFEEHRLMLRREPTAETVDSAALAQALAYSAPQAGLSRAWASPDRQRLDSVLKQVILSDAVQTSPMNETSDAAGNDLETRIDEPPFSRNSASSIDEVSTAIWAMGPKAILHNEANESLTDRVFLLPVSEAVILCDKPDLTALTSAVNRSIPWAKRSTLDPLRLQLVGNALIVSRIQPHIPVTAPLVEAGQAYVAVYRHAGEWPRFKRLFNLFDRDTTNSPAFFSGNLKGLGDSLPRLTKASISAREMPDGLRETVRYDFATR